MIDLDDPEHLQAEGRVNDVNPLATGGQFGQYKLMQKSWKNDLNHGIWVFIC